MAPFSVVEDDIYRRVLVSHYCNSWSLLPWQLKEGESSAKSDWRGVIQVAGSDPYAWKGYEWHQKTWRTCVRARRPRRRRGAREQGKGNRV